jgi:ERF superfamily
MNAIAPIAPIAPEDAAADRSLLNIVAMAVRDPAIDVAKLETLLRMQREIVAGDARLQFNRSMSLAQGEMQPVLRDATNDQTRSRYARLETIDAAVRPIYTRHGFCLEFNSEPIEGPNGQARIVCEVSHFAGHTKKFQLEAALDTAGPQGKANKTPLHGLGSTVSYLRRYLVCMIFNVVLAHDDNDGNRAQWGNENGQLTEAQADELHDLMARGRIREGAVLEKMAPGLRSISQLPSTEFPRVRNALLSRLNVIEQRMAAERAAAARQPRGDRP